MPRARKLTVLTHAPDKLPDPWLVDSEFLLNELARLREIILKIPVANNSILPINNAIDAIWRTEQQLRYLLSLHKDAQSAFARKGIREVAKTAPETIQATAPTQEIDTCHNATRVHLAG